MPTERDDRAIDDTTDRSLEELSDTPDDSPSVTDTGADDASATRAPGDTATEAEDESWMPDDGMVPDDLEGPDPEGDDDYDSAEAEEAVESPRTIITEALAPRLSRRAIMAVSGVTVVLALGTGLVAGATGNQSRSVEMSSLTSTSQSEVSPRDASGIAANAAQSVFRLQAGNQSGSGWLMEPDVLVTNAHVAVPKVGEKLAVTAPSGEEFEGEVLMKDVDLDVALIQIPRQEAEPLSLVGVDEQKPGQPVVLAGYPLGLDLSVTSGIASAIDTVTNLRESPAQHSLLQIDAPVNPGSSGGPVLDSQGRVMGMATSRPDTVGDRPVQGVAFAVPANDIVVSLRQYNEHGDVNYGYLGVSLTDEAGGATVDGVTAGSPAESVGLAEGDVITSVDGYPAESYTQVSRYLHMFRDGDEVKLGVKSGDKTKAVNVVLGKPSR